MIDNVKIFLFLLAQSLKYQPRLILEDVLIKENNLIKEK